ncbi:right-handed parallel beta-helix repeat-containing protein [Deferrisoma sp.]
MVDRFGLEGWKAGRLGGQLRLVGAACLVAFAVCVRAEETQIRWSGGVALDRPLTVEAGQTLVVEPGTEIAAGPEGTVLVQGKAYLLGAGEAPVRIRGTREAPTAVFQMNAPEAVLRLHRVEAEGCGTVVGATAGTVVVTDSAFRRNATALRLQMRTRGVLRDVTFEENDLGLAADNGALVTVDDAVFRRNKVGVGAGNSVRLTVRGSRFEANETGYGQMNGADTAIEDCAFTGQTGAAVFLRQSRRSPRISFCRFAENEVGVAAWSTSHPLVEASEFRKNKRAFDAKEFCGPLLRFNAFEENGEAVRLDHKSGAKVFGNRFRGNGVALFLDFSSYPEVRGNRFEKNEWHVRLGRFMSADWERRQGSAGYTLQNARGRNTRNPMMQGAGRLPEAAGTVDVSQNAWDADTLAEMAAGPEANLTRLWDGRDQPEVTYPDWGTGDETFRLDMVRYDPPLGRGIPAGPPAWVPRQERDIPSDPGGRGPPPEQPMKNR